MDDLLCPGTLPPFTPFPKTDFSLGEIGLDGGCPEAIVTSVRGGQEVLLCSKMHGFCGIDEAAKDTLTKFRSVQPPTPLPEAVLRRKIFEPPWTAHDVADKLINEAWLVQQLDQSVYEGIGEARYLAQFTGARFLKSGVKIKQFPLLEAPIQALAGIGPVKDPPLIGNCLDTHWCEDKRTLKLLHGEGLYYKWLRQRDFNYRQKDGIFVKPKTHEGGVELTEFARKFPAPITQVEYLGKDKERALVRTVDSVYTCDIDTGPLDDYSVLCGGKCRHFGTSPHIDSEIFVLDEEGELLWCKAGRELNRIDTASPGDKSGDLVSAVWSDHPRVIFGARNTEVTGFDLRTGTVATNLWKAEERKAEVCKLISSPLPGLFPIVQNHKVVLVDDRRPGVAVQSWWIPLAGVPEFASSTYIPSRSLTEPGLLPVILAQRLFNEVVCLPNIINLVRDGTASILCGGSAPLSLSTPSEYASWFQDHIPQVELKKAYRRICAPLRGMKTDLINDSVTLLLLTDVGDVSLQVLNSGPQYTEDRKFHRGVISEWRKFAEDIAETDADYSYEPCNYSVLEEEAERFSVVETLATRKYAVREFEVATDRDFGGSVDADRETSLDCENCDYLQDAFDFIRNVEISDEDVPERFDNKVFADAVSACTVFAWHKAYDDEEEFLV